MARRELGPAALRVAQAVLAGLPGEDVVVGCSGGADSLALALGAQWAAAKTGVAVEAVTIDHGLQPGSGEVAAAVAAQLSTRGLDARVIAVQVGEGPNLEARAREARLAALAASRRPVLLGHTLDDQAETVLLGLARGSGTRSLAGMAPVRGLFRRPLLGLRRAVTEQACREWDLRAWSDPHNADERFARVRVRTRVLPVLEAELGPGVAEALARTAEVLRADLAAQDDPEPGQAPTARWLAGLDPAQRARVLKGWLDGQGVSGATLGHVRAVEALVTDWRGQKGVDLPGLRVRRIDGALVAVPRPVRGS
ncbi:MAG: tRNA lysidine(34) synthetase TilS [Propionibacteriaceae bacterium]|nr:tRNA lysidine(34) synthetase TilS [Propionibacteriaceae bacterium]